MKAAHPFFRRMGSVESDAYLRWFTNWSARVQDMLSPIGRRRRGAGAVSIGLCVERWLKEQFN